MRIASGRGNRAGVACESDGAPSTIVPGLRQPNNGVLDCIYAAAESSAFLCAMGEGPELHLLNMLLVENLLNGDELDEPLRAFVEVCCFLLRIAGVGEGHEEPSLPVLALHHRLE